MHDKIDYTNYTREQLLARINELEQSVDALECDLMERDEDIEHLLDEIEDLQES